VGWRFFQVVEDLDNIKAYDWAETICATLMESIKGFYSKPEKVTGCVTLIGHKDKICGYRLAA